MTASPDFTYWNSVDPASFLDHDWQNPSRVWATKEAVKAADGGSLLEIGPGPGVDYARHFHPHVQSGALTYRGVEGSQTLHDSLRSRFPEAAWQHATIADLKPQSADVVYARHVMEHQPSLEPALSQVLGAARHVVVLTWYRPPGPQAFYEIWEGVHCQTFARVNVLAAVAKAGFRIAHSEFFESGDECWLLERK
jgi:hypothetical protein